MKSLLGIQQEVKRLEAIIKDVSESLESINLDLEEHRKLNRDEAEINFEKISILAKQLPFEFHPINNLQDKRVKKLYIEILVSVIRLFVNDRKMVDRLIFIQWLKEEMGVQESMEELLNSSYKMDIGTFDVFADTLSTRYKKYFLADILILANLGEKKVEVYRYIADIVEVLRIDTRELQMTIKVVNLFLKDGYNKIPKEEVNDELWNWVHLFSHYIDVSKVEEKIKEGRTFKGRIILEISKEKVIDFSLKTIKNNRVGKGKIIATYYLKRKSSKPPYFEKSEMKEVKAKYPGYVYFYEDKDKYYIALGNVEDSKKSLHDW